jgi:hypothetical protein
VISILIVKKILGKLYRSIPLIRELIEIRDSVRSLPCELEKIRTTQAIWFLSQEIRTNPRYGEPKRLLRHASQVCSQNGEDGIIHEIFRRIGHTNRVFVEIGVGDGVENNTAFLLSQGWSGTWIDGSEFFVSSAQNDTNCSAEPLQRKVAFVTEENVAQLLRGMKISEEFDLLSLDIDQNTYFAWKGLKEFRPRVAVIEYNASIPPDVDWKVRYDPTRMADGSHCFGASLKALEILGQELGYKLVGCDPLGVNAFFVRSDLVGDHFAAPFVSENHYEPPGYAVIHRRGHRNSLLDRS